MIDTAGATNEQIFWMIATAYIGKCLGLLDPATKSKLDAMFLGKPRNWTEQVEAALGINPLFVEAIYALCIERNGKGAAIGFILRGLGCPPDEVDARVRELSVAM